MRAVDTSILAYALNRYAPEHARALAVIDELANGDRPWAVPWPAVHELLQRVTHPHGVARALRPADAWAFVEELGRSHSLRFLGAGAGHGGAAADVIEMLRGEPGPLAPGFEVAVVLREHGVRELLSSDPGMRRFRFLEVRDPVHGELWHPAEPPARRYRTLARSGSRRTP